MMKNIQISIDWQFSKNSKKIKIKKRSNDQIRQKFKMCKNLSNNLFENHSPKISEKTANLQNWKISLLFLRASSTVHMPCGQFIISFSQEEKSFKTKMALSKKLQICQPLCIKSWHCVLEVSISRNFFCKFVMSHLHEKYLGLLRAANVSLPSSFP